MDGKPSAAAPKIQEKDVRGLKYFDQLAPLLERLHDVGCKRDRAGNRSLHFDQYCMLILLFFFNPVVKSLRGLQQASELKNVQKKLGCPRTSLGSLSESVTVFDPERLKEIIAELGGQLEPLGRDPRLKDIRDTVTLVDSTLLSILPHLTEASLKPTNTSGLVKWRLHTHFEVDRHVPRRIDVTPDGGGDCDERAVLERTIESDRLYVMDRGYAKFALFNRIVAAQSSYVCRIRDNSVYEVLEERPLSPAALAERVTGDKIIALGAESAADEPDASRASDHHPGEAASEEDHRAGPRLRWHAPHRHQLARRARRDHRAALPLPLDHRDLLPLLQADPGLPASAERFAKRHRDPDLLRDHRLHVDQLVDRQEADPADLRDDLLVFHRRGRP